MGEPSPLLDGEAVDRQLYRCASPDPVIAEQGLLELAYAVDRAQDYLRDGVATMRRTGRSWKAIGDALGLSAQEAEQRYDAGPPSNVTELRPRPRHRQD